MPLSIGKKIFDSFGSGEKKNLTTPELLDKAICYVIVLGESVRTNLISMHPIFLYQLSHSGLLASKLQLETILLTESVFVRVRHWLYVQVANNSELFKADHLKKLVAMVGAHMVADNQKILLKVTLCLRT